jgi:hypothetical protein
MLDKPDNEEIKFDPPPDKLEKVLLYSQFLWKGVVPVFQCGQCEFSCEVEDDIKLHVLSHFPPEQQDTVLERLVYMKGA